MFLDDNDDDGQIHPHFTYLLLPEGKRHKNEEKRGGKKRPNHLSIQTPDST